jgi:hypothetical protein
MSERVVLAQVLLALSRGASRLFRSNAGMGWQGRVLHRNAQSLTLGNPRALHAMPAGTPDCIGWTTVTVTPEMIGRKVAVFTGIETKHRSGMSDEQRNFIERVQAAGGIAGCAHSVEEAQAIVADWRPP